MAHKEGRHTAIPLVGLAASSRPPSELSWSRTEPRSQACACRSRTRQNECQAGHTRSAKGNVRMAGTQRVRVIPTTRRRRGPDPTTETWVLPTVDGDTTEEHDSEQDQNQYPQPGSHPRPPFGWALSTGCFRVRNLPPDARKKEHVSEEPGSGAAWRPWRTCSLRRIPLQLRNHRLLAACLALAGHVPTHDRPVEVSSSWATRIRARA